MYMSLLPDQDTLKHCRVGLYLYKKVLQAVTLGETQELTPTKRGDISVTGPPQGCQLPLLCLCGMHPGVEVWKSSLVQDLGL